MANRLIDRIATIQARIDAIRTGEGGKASPKQLAKLGKDLKTEWKDLVEYQSLQSQAHAAGKLSLEEAQLIYQLLGGENPTEEKWDRLTLAQRVAITQVMSELIDWRIRMGSRSVHYGAVIKSTVRSKRSDSGIRSSAI